MRYLILLLTLVFCLPVYGADYVQRYPTGTAIKVYDTISADTLFMPATSDTLFLKLDQTTPQTVSGGSPIFDGGLQSNDHILIDADNKYLRLGADQDFDIYHDGTNAYIDSNTGDIYFVSAGGDNIYDGNITIDSDSKRIYFGADQDADMYHDGTNLRITTTNGDIYYTPAGGQVLYYGDALFDGNYDLTVGDDITLGDVGGATQDLTFAGADNNSAKMTYTDATQILKVGVGGTFNTFQMDNNNKLGINGTPSTGNKVFEIWDSLNALDGEVAAIHTDSSNMYAMTIYDDAFSSITPVFDYYPADDGSFAMGTRGAYNFDLYTNSYVNLRLRIEGDGEILLYANDANDYIKLTTTSNVPAITTLGNCDLKIDADGGDVDFSDNNITTSGSITTTASNVSVATNGKFNLEGSAGDTYFTFDGTNVYLYVNGVLSQQWGSE